MLAFVDRFNKHDKLPGIDFLFLNPSYVSFSFRYLFEIYNIVAVVAEILYRRQKKVIACLG